MITALGLGTKQAPENVNLDPQRQFWSWLTPFMSPDDRTADSYHHQRAYFSGFACTQTTPAGMTIQIGGTAEADSAVLFIADGDKTKAVLLSTDGEPEVVTIPTAPASGSRIDAVVSYIDTTSADPEGETPGTPEYVKTIVVSGTAAGSPSAPTDAQIVSALPAGANSRYYRWCDVRVAANQTTITNSNITDKKPASPNVYIAASTVQRTVNPAPYGLTWTIIRAGNVVISELQGNLSSGMNQGPLSFVEPVPAGFRPINATSWMPIEVLTQSPAIVGQVSANPDGSVTGYCNSKINTGAIVVIRGVWVTDDNWPS